MSRKGYVVESLDSGRWSLRLLFHDGTKKRAGQTFETREDADAAGRATAEELGLDQASGLTLASYVTAPKTGWLDKRDKMGRRANATVRSIVRTWIAPSSLWTRPLTAIRKRDVRALVEHVFQQRAEQTARNVYNVLRRILADAYDEARVRENCAAGVKLPKRPRVDDGWTFLSSAEINAVLNVAQPHEREVIAFAIFTGLRSGELRALRLIDLDLDDAKMTVRFGAPGKPTKGGKPREVWLNQHALAALRRWLASARPNKHGLVFPGDRGRPRAAGHILGRMHVAPNVYIDRWTIVAAQAGLFDAEPKRPAVWHSLRHTCASHLVSGSWGRRWTLEEVRDVLGHKDITTTQRYAHLATSTMREAARSTGDPGDDESPEKQAISTKTLGFLNQRSRFRLTPGALKLQAKFVAPENTLDIVWELLVAIERDDAQGAEKAAGSLAEAILGSVQARLALEVLDGGPMMLARALQLAEAVVDVESLRAAKLGVGRAGAGR